MHQTHKLRIVMASSLIIGLFAVACLAAPVPKVTYMRTCTSVTERPSQFEASGWTMQFDVGDAVYCVVKVDIPYNASRSSYDATMKWYTPSGDLYHEHDYKDLERGYIWSLWGSIDEADVAGQWRVTFSLKYATGRSVSFNVAGEPNSDHQHPSPTSPSVRQVTGREKEPNDSADTANALILDNRVQGEARYYSRSVYDQDWFSIYLPGARTYWIEINAIGETSGWISTNDFVTLYAGNDAKRISFSLYSSQKRDTDKSTCDVVIPLTGPGKYYILLSTHDFGHNLVYSLQVTTTIPAWAEGKL